MKKVIGGFIVALLLFNPILSLNVSSEIVKLDITYNSNHTSRSLIEKFEGVRLKAYRCPSGIPTIGMGFTYYEDGNPVRIGDRISLVRMNQLYNFKIKEVERQLNNLIKVELNNNQKSALISFLYNVGYGNFKRSKLLKVINNNPNDFRIHNEFMKWTTSKGKYLKGLENRRKEELQLYFTTNKN